MGINSNMTQEEFVLFAKAALDGVMDLLTKKGQQYSKDSAFSNFEEGATFHGLTPGHYLMVLATKHWHNLCKNPDNDVSERANDVIVYMLLLKAMTMKGPIK